MFVQHGGDFLEEVRPHIGCHPKMMGRLVDHTMFISSLRRLRKAVLEHDSQQQMVIVAFCRAGEKRSVAWATIAQHILLKSHWVATEGIQHLSRWFWRYNTCQAQGCALCTTSNVPNKKTLDKAWQLWRMVLQEE